MAEWHCVSGTDHQITRQSDQETTKTRQERPLCKFGPESHEQEIRIFSGIAQGIDVVETLVQSQMLGPWRKRHGPLVF